MNSWRLESSHHRCARSLSLRRPTCGDVCLSLMLPSSTGPLPCIKPVYGLNGAPLAWQPCLYGHWEEQGRAGRAWPKPLLVLPEAETSVQAGARARLERCGAREELCPGGHHGASLRAQTCQFRPLRMSYSTSHAETLASVSGVETSTSGCDPPNCCARQHARLSSPCFCVPELPVDSYTDCKHLCDELTS